MIDDNICHTSRELKRIMASLSLKKKKKARGEQMYLPLFDTSKNGKIIMLRDPPSRLKMIDGSMTRGQ